MKANTFTSSAASRSKIPMILCFEREFAWRGRSLRTTLVKRPIAIVFAAFLAFVAVPNAWAQSAGTGRTNIVKIRTLQIDASARPGVGQFVPADDNVQHLVYELYVTN